MDFNIYELDKIEPGSAEAEKALKKYQNTLRKRFYDSPEGQAHARAYPEMGFWAAQLIYYGYGYIGFTLTQMTAKNVEEIVTEWFPRKVSLSSPDEADAAIPELVAFWEYLKLEYMLASADSVLDSLHKIKPEFKRMMNDTSKFGMAKSFVMLGKSAGFDMTKKEEMDSFNSLYNAGLLARKEGLEGSSLGLPDAARN